MYIETSQHLPEKKHLKQNKTLVSVLNWKLDIDFQYILVKKLTIWSFGLMTGQWFQSPLLNNDDQTKCKYTLFFLSVKVPNLNCYTESLIFDRSIINLWDQILGINLNMYEINWL